MYPECAKRDGNHLLWYNLGLYQRDVTRLLDEENIEEEHQEIYIKEAAEFYHKILQEYIEYDKNPKWYQWAQIHGHKFDRLEKPADKSGYKIALAR